MWCLRMWCLIIIDVAFSLTIGIISLTYVTIIINRFTIIIKHHIPELPTYTSNIMCPRIHTAHRHHHWLVLSSASSSSSSSSSPTSCTWHTHTHMVIVCAHAYTRARDPSCTQSWERWEVLLGIRLLGTTCWCGLSNRQAATAQMGTSQAELSLRITKHRGVPTPLGAAPLSLKSRFCSARHPAPSRPRRPVRRRPRWQPRRQRLQQHTWYLLLSLLLWLLSCLWSNLAEMVFGNRTEGGHGACGRTWSVHLPQNL